jgi:hypothetical protein
MTHVKSQHTNIHICDAPGCEEPIEGGPVRARCGCPTYAFCTTTCRSAVGKATCVYPALDLQVPDRLDELHWKSPEAVGQRQADASRRESIPEPVRADSDCMLPEHLRPPKHCTNPTCHRSLAAGLVIASCGCSKCAFCSEGCLTARLNERPCWVHPCGCTRVPACKTCERKELHQPPSEPPRSSPEHPKRSCVSCRAPTLEGGRCPLCRVRLCPRCLPLHARTHISPSSDAAATKALLKKKQQKKALLPSPPLVSGPSAAPEPTSADERCVVCLDARPTHVALGCGHLSTCDTCTESCYSKAGSPCVVCRAPVSGVLKVFRT